jgi:wobble nucleotide-excising tRNase
MSGVASYKNAAVLEIDKKLNLIYGLNGSGKSTVSDYLYNPKDSRFSDCKIEGLTNEDVLVYNQRFIRDYFYESDSLKGIFTLSKENREAEEKVRIAEKEITKFETEKQQKTAEQTLLSTDLQEKTIRAETKTWEIKTAYAGGDRVLEFCLENLKGQKEKLFNHIIAIEKPESVPAKTVEQIKKEVESIRGANAQKYGSLPKLQFSSNNIESDPLFKKQIVGNENSSVADLINTLKNSDWVKRGFVYLPENILKDGEKCPFCQQKTVTPEFVTSIKEFFDESYENNLRDIRNLQSQYETAYSSITKKESYEANPFINDKKSNFENLYNKVQNIIEKNIEFIKEKVNSPSREINLQESSSDIASFNVFIDEINSLISEHNEKIDNKEKSLTNLKTEFWSLMRWEYDQTISTYFNDKSTIEQKINTINSRISELDKKTGEQRAIAVEEQKKTVNIEEAIQSINNGLVDLGIHGFRIEKYKNNLYTLVREEKCDEAFHTLSEGEKMVISFLYFIELCKGKRNAETAASKKIIVIDDPISSLSHIYVFNIGRLIKKEFYGKKETKNGVTTWSYKYEQVFILTHSLYFFYEITETKPDDRKETQELIRLGKNADGSYFKTMKYEEIQNDYQAYWYIVKDEKHPPALIANSMRNIIEYFFNFVEKKDLNNFFNQPLMQDNRFQAFYRYINRESHSLGQNIFDYKEFNYDDFKEAFAALFTTAGYEDHYKRMIS